MSGFIAPGYAQDAEPAPTLPPERAAALDREIDQIAVANHVRGCSVAIFEGESILYSHAYGVAAQRGDTVFPASPDTKYRIASISKMLSGVLVMSLVEQGALHLEDDLSALIHPNLVNPFCADTPPQLRHLLTHTSGIYDSDVYRQAIAEGPPFPSLTSLLEEENAFLKSRPGAGYNYSNFAMGLTAAAVEQATGERFHDYANRVLFAPMEIDGGYLTDFVADKSTIAAFADVDPAAWGNMHSAYSAFPLGQNYLLAQGEVYISANDLAKILMVLAGDGSWNGTRFLEPETVEAINTPQYSLPAAEITRGFGIQIVDGAIDGVSLRGHQGNAYGAISCAFYDPDTARGVVFLTNGSDIVYGNHQLYRVNEAVLHAAWDHLFEPAPAE